MGLGYTLCAGTQLLAAHPAECTGLAKGSQPYYSQETLGERLMNQNKRWTTTNDGPQWAIWAKTGEGQRRAKGNDGRRATTGHDG